MTEAARIVLGVSGGIAAYKACEVVRRLRDRNHDVLVVPTESALKFVGATTWEALSGHPVSTSVFDDVDQVPHVRIGVEADLVAIVPATADLLSRAATGRADDLLTNVLLTATAPQLMFPAMHTQMWQHAATVANVATLRSRGVLVKDPGVGRLTGPDSGPGRLPEPDEIVDVILACLAEPALVRQAATQDLAGLKVAISAGGTREALDPVRYVGNASSGVMGLSLARVAALRGADVTLVVGHIEVEVPSGAKVSHVVSTADLATAMNDVADEMDVIVMAAAVADFTPAEPSLSKIKKSGDADLVLRLTQTTDVLAGLAATKRAGQTIVGFAAETAADTTDLLELGRAKLARKGADLLVLNDVSSGQVFGQPDNRVIIISPSGIVGQAAGSKTAVAAHIWDAVATLRAASN